MPLKLRLGIGNINQGTSCASYLLTRSFVPSGDIITFARECRVDKIVVGIERLSSYG